MLVVLLAVFLLVGCAGETAPVPTPEPPTPEIVETPVPEATPEPTPVPEAPESPPAIVSGNIVVPEDPTELIRFVETFALEAIVITDNTGRQELSISPSVITIARLELFYTVSGTYFDAFEMITERTGPLLFAAYLALDEEQQIQFSQLIADSEA